MRYPITLLCASLAAPALADSPAVVTGTPVVHSLVAQVMGDLGTPVVLLDRGSDPHSFQLRPSQAQALAGADMLFWVGPELTPWLQRALDGVGSGAQNVALLAAEGVHLREYGHEHGHDHSHDDHEHGHDDHDHEHGHDDHGHDQNHDDHGHDDHGHGHDDHGHEHEHEHGHDDHDDHGHEHSHDDHGHDHSHDDHDHGHDHAHDGLDPHAWLNTENAKAWLDVIAATLGAHDPANAATYAANADAAKAGIDSLTAQVQATLAPVGDSALIVFHDAYGYFAEQFGLNIAGTIALGDAAAPGAARLTELRAMLAEEGVVCIFPEVNHSSRYVDVVVEGTGVHVGVELDPAGVSLEYGPGLYAELLTGLAQNISDCAGHAH